MSSPIDIVFVPSLEVMTVEEQIKMCGETFDQRQARHLTDNQTNIRCLGCDEILWNLRYDADKKISKLISGGLRGYVCGDESVLACAPEDEEASEYGEETDEEDEEDEEEQRCPCGLTLSDNDLALESGKCEGCTMKNN